MVRCFDQAFSRIKTVRITGRVLISCVFCSPPTLLPICMSNHHLSLVICARSNWDCLDAPPAVPPLHLVPTNLSWLVTPSVKVGIIVCSAVSQSCTQLSTHPPSMLTNSYKDVDGLWSSTINCNFVVPVMQQYLHACHSI